uniref:Uncharacterized protein n=1 Tax=Panagrolaimus davidi TaxID=227884 RepID=A0A914Q9P3_9BILA
MQDSENTVSQKNPKSNIEFLTFDDQQKLCYSGYCKLKINAIGKYLTVEPINKDFKPLSAFFKWKFVQRKNILYIFSENKIEDLILVFKTEKICKKVLLCIEKYSDNASNDEKLDQIHFCVPFVQQLKNHDILRIARNFIRLFSDKEKKKFAQVLKENELYETVFPLLPLYGNKNDNTEKLKDSLKRKRREFREDDDSDYSSPEDAENVRQQKSQKPK